MNHSTIRLGIALLLLALASRAHAQQILYNTNGRFESGPIVTAMFDLGLDFTAEADDDELLALLRTRTWDLVIVRLRDPYGPTHRADILAEFEAHVNRGGALMFSIAQLDEMPDFWPLLGIEGARDLELPLSFISGAHPGGHPASGGMAVGDFIPSSDYGDALTPTTESFALSVFFDTRATAIAMSESGSVIVNGQEWDQWSTSAGIRVATKQIQWLLGCPADLDGDGGTTVFDFLEFQNRFDSGGASGFADFSYDGRLDVFDFLEFLNLFAGC